MPVIGISCALAATTPGAALAASSPAIADCTAHGRLTQHYSVAQLHNALSAMPADVQEYTNCYDVIQNALLAEIPGKHKDAPSSSSGGSSVSTPVVAAIVVLALGGITAGAVAIRRRNTP